METRDRESRYDSVEEMIGEAIFPRHSKESRNQGSRYSVLAGYGRLIAGLGWAGVIVSVLIACVGLTLFYSNEATLKTIVAPICLAVGLVGSIQSLLTVASGQVILCFVSIEENTRRTAEGVQELVQQRQAGGGDG